MFTAWCWNLLGISFAINGALTLLVQRQQQHEYCDSNNNSTKQIMPICNYEQKYENFDDHKIPHLMLRIALLSFEIAVPMSMLVSCCVRYVLWPQALTKTKDHFMKRFRPLIQHNANVIVALLELCVLGKYQFVSVISPSFHYLV